MFPLLMYVRIITSNKKIPIDEAYRSSVIRNLFFQQGLDFVGIYGL